MSENEEDIDEFVSSIGKLVRAAINDDENDIFDYLEELAERVDELEEGGDDAGDAE
ncbi:hypothetical protein [Halomicrobium sp. LC1Hm]|uniref:hypothetical protein n=1 Tax=Halomicrobium sp. LC1Hm TaxID=2610902 RepID=UPI00129830D9|nr:hypothetical protein [Halomicrobium sp. LC1Hm]QGA82099.1 hypothetical protein LC1Hm_1039 [Halomicrobium sp. LC1Hm]